jgi:hypothetical protein
VIIVAIQKGRGQLAGPTYLFGRKSLTKPAYICVYQFLALGPVHAITPWTGGGDSILQNAQNSWNIVPGSLSNVKVLASTG